MRCFAELVKANDIDADDVAAAFFTTTPDLNADFPAAAARLMGWTHVALLDAVEIDVPALSVDVHSDVNPRQHGQARLMSWLMCISGGQRTCVSGGLRNNCRLAATHSLLHPLLYFPLTQATIPLCIFVS